ncbi:G-protein coupled receptor family C group 6 member A-like [Gordionus sp. m RMFG-2023]|uniref:G-protein coupled receptor family C group 6 member A-like n=1 Tax=Gordionus sp. m RMFG-2023 TaxID=3053472 RepID=UPI0031FD3039
MKLFKQLTNGMATNLIFIALNNWPGSYALQKSGVANIALGTIIIINSNSHLVKFWTKFRDYMTTAIKVNRYRSNPFSINIQKNISMILKDFHDEIFIHQTALIVDSTEILFRALIKLLKDKCSVNDFNECLRSNLVNKAIFPFIDNINFTGITNQIHFQDRIVTDNHFIIENYKKWTNNRLATIKIGIHDTKSNTINFSGEFQWLHMSNNQNIIETYKWPMNPKSFKLSNIPSSSCSQPCEYLKIRTLTIPTDSLCCWTCKSCDVFKQILTTKISQPCLTCPKYFRANQNQSMCVALPVRYIGNVYFWPHLIKILGSVALFIFMIFLLLYLICYDNLAFRSEILILMNVNLLGILLGIISALFITGRITKITCEMAQITYMLSFNFILSSFLVKIKCLSTRFSSLKIDQKNDQINYKSMYCFLFGMIGLQLAINIVGLLADSTLNPLYREYIQRNSNADSHVKIFCKLYTQSMNNKLITR